MAFERSGVGCHWHSAPVASIGRKRGLAESNSRIIPSLHDVGLAAWFGGTLANAVALNAAAAAPRSDHDKGQVAKMGWDRWTPVSAAAIGATSSAPAVCCWRTAVESRRSRAWA